MKKILIVTHAFPPANTMSSRRWAEMLPELAKEYQVFVFTQKLAGDLKVPIKESQIKRTGNFQGQKALTLSAKKASKVRKVIRLFTSRLRTIDSNILWYFNKRREFWNYYQSIMPDYLITSIGPFSSALFGYELKIRKENLTWIIDIRDPISLSNEDEKNRLEKYIDKTIDLNIIKKADMITTVGEILSELMSAFYMKKVYPIYNGFDTFNFDRNEIKVNQKKYLQLYYAGRMYPHREEALFLLLRVLKDNNNFHLKLRLLDWQLNYDRYSEYLIKHGITNVTLSEPAPAKVVESEERNADILIIFEDLSARDPISRGNLTGKLFEYLKFDSPILAICREDSEIKKILDQTNRGKVLSTLSEIGSFLQALKAELYRCDHNKVYEYSRSNQAKKFISLLQQ